MPYYIRVLGTSLADIPVQQLRESASPALIEVVERSGEAWEQLVLKHPSGVEIALIEKTPVLEGELGADELKEFQDEVLLYRPSAGARWLQNYLQTVKVIYSFQVLSGTNVADGWAGLHRVHSAVWESAGGILQADGEGFSNEDGYTILWQFGESVTGMWNVALLIDGDWVPFEIDLGNQQHREAFQQGQVPAGARVP
jgi:hypothetical protein